ncbi:MAG: hypothetical protein KDK05_30510, partial [Candidatus Competibacteraceae bacterium]|nr:hypothetical protein [Candidatus Competibacteraceae bacterium]
SYPLPTQWTEIGELVLDPGAEVAYAFGLERLVYVTTSLWPSWHDRRKQLLTRVETEVAASGEAFPEGYYLFKG